MRSAFLSLTRNSVGIYIYIQQKKKKKITNCSFKIYAFTRLIHYIVKQSLISAFVAVMGVISAQMKMHHIPDECVEKLNATSRNVIISQIWKCILLPNAVNVCNGMKT